MSDPNPYSVLADPDFVTGQTISATGGTSVPGADQFGEVARSRRVTPVVRRLSFSNESPVATYVKLTQSRPGTFLLESAEHGRQWSRYSFIGVRSQAILSEQSGTAIWAGDVPESIDQSIAGLDTVSQVLGAFYSERIHELPPLTSGLVGYLGYDVVRRWEQLPVATVNDLDLPEFTMFLVTDLAIMDHELGQVILVSNVFADPGQSDAELAAAYQEANEHLDRMQAALSASLEVVELVDAEQVATKESPLEISSNTTRAEYLAKVETVREYIRAGDAFQVVVSQRFECESDSDPVEIYRALRELNPSPYMYLFRIPELATFAPDASATEAFAVVGSSPEALVKLVEGQATLHPIAGTRPRASDPAQDDALADELLADKKELAEHLMLVDLGRNDLGRVCLPGSVKVTEFMNVERYSHVMHIVSTVVGDLDPQANAYDLLRAAHPAGTLSGAPKVRAMEIIEELEQTRRGIYAGCVGYFDFAGDMDTAIAIRTAVVRSGKAFVQAGAGLVADSDPQSEYEECQNKAAAVFRAIAVAASLEPIGDPTRTPETDV